MGEHLNKRRVFEESLLRDDVVDYYLSKEKAELEEVFGRDVSKMVGFEQKNCHHCYDLWEHTLRTVEGIKKDGLTVDQFKKLRVAAFFHDIGKPDVASFNDKTGQQVFYGHAVHSVDVAKPILYKLGYSTEEISQLGFLIGHHDDFISYKSRLEFYMKNHLYIRNIDEKSVAEKIIENKYDFIAMGYNTEQIRVICYILAHDKRPSFKTKNGFLSIDVNMNDVKEALIAGDYKAFYDASLEDYQMLLKLCTADNEAQSEIAIQNSRVVGSKKEKLENIANINNVLSKAYDLVEEKTK